jgi:hypothetical protein
LILLEDDLLTQSSERHLPSSLTLAEIQNLRTKKKFEAVALQRLDGELQTEGRQLKARLQVKVDNLRKKHEAQLEEMSHLYQECQEDMTQNQQKERADLEQRHRLEHAELIAQEQKDRESLVERFRADSELTKLMHWQEKNRLSLEVKRRLNENTEKGLNQVLDLIREREQH